MDTELFVRSFPPFIEHSDWIKLPVVVKLNRNHTVFKRKEKGLNYGLKATSAIGEKC